jgi:glycerol-3-phosphate cytidylyltransferase
MDKKIELLQTLKTIQTELTENGFKCWLDYGQLLSAKRTNKLLPWDNDIDFGVLITDKNKINYLNSIISKYLKPRYQRIGAMLFQSVFNKYTKNGFVIDFFCWYEKDKMYHSPYSRTNGLDMRSFFFDELDDIELDGISFKCPRHLDLYLKILYGDTWMTPIQKSNATTSINPGIQYQNKQFHCIVTGVFDLLHEGHINILKKAKKEFDILTVGICNDDTVESYKRKPINNQNKRYHDILNLRLADNIITDFPLICNEESLKDYDFIMYGREENNHLYYKCEHKNHPINRTENISTTMIIETLNS